MNNKIYIWTKFTIPEWGDHWFLSVDTIDKIKKAVDRRRISVTWFRTNEWIHWEFGRFIDEDTRNFLQTEIMMIIKAERPAPKGRDPLLRWEGSCTEVNTALALNEHIQ